MQHRFLLGGLAALALMAAAPITYAQPDPRESAQTQQPAAPATPPTITPQTPATAPPANPNPVTPTSPPDRVAPGAPAPSTTGATPQGCRTRMEAGEQCACLSDTANIGTSTADPAGGRNICVRPG